MNITESLQGYRIAKLADGFSELTLAAYVSALKLLAEYLHDPDINSITTNNITSFFAYLRTDYEPKFTKEDKLSSNSFHRYFKACRSYFKWLNVEFDIDRPDLALKTPETQSKEIIPFTEREISDMLSACEYSQAVKSEGRKIYQFKRHTATRDKAIVMFLLDTGLRVGEFNRLLIRDIDIETGDVHVRVHHVRKTKARTVYMGKSTRRQVWKYLMTRDAQLPDDPLFTTMDDSPSTRHSIYELLSTLGDRANVEGVHPHRFRHTFAIQYLRNGGDIFTLQRLLGHSSLQMVRHYLRIAESDDKDAHRRASPVDRWKL